MTHHLRHPGWAGSLTTICMAMTLCTAARGEILSLQITLDGSQEVPPVDTPAIGSGTATLDTVTREFSWNVSFAGLLGTQTAAHFHGTAALCETAGVQVGLPLGSPIVGSATLTAQQVDDVIAQLWYLNVHSTMHPSGEIRGQVMHAELADPLPDPIAPSKVLAELREVASGLTAPNWGISRPGHPGQLIVSDQNGVLWDITILNGQKRVFLDATALLVKLGVGGKGTFDERGLLGVAFDADFMKSGLLYTYTSQPAVGAADFSTMPPGEDPDHHAVITEWQVPDPGNPASVVDPGSARELLRIDEPQFNHDGGGLDVGGDGMLYISLGDGGARDDQGTGHACIGNGRNNETILGTVLRIDPAGNNSGNGQYGIPGDNPFVGGPGLDEIYAYGLRNPFRISFDRGGVGDLYIADVGQGAIEEVNIGVSGGNYGWNEKEGSFFFAPNGDSSGYVHDIDPGVTPGLLDPIAEYDHDEGISVIGGFVYRGTLLPDLIGSYVFGDWNQTFFGDNGRLFHLQDVADGTELVELQPTGGLGRSLHGFGQDAAGEVYVLANNGGVPFGTSGVVLKMLPPLTTTVPSAVAVPFGEVTGGDVTDLAASDDQYLEIQQRPAVSVLLPLIRADVSGTSPLSTIAVLTADVEAAATSLPTTPPQRISLRNFDALQYEIVDERLATMSDSVVRITVCEDADRFVSDVDDSMIMRLEWFDPGNVFFPAWGVRIDEATWAVD